jgi:fucose permease
MTYNKPRLFLVSLLALCTAGISFAIRSSVASEMQAVFFDPIDKLRSAEMIGTVLGVAFLGFAVTVGIGSMLLDLIGMGRLLALSSCCFIVGTLVVINAASIAQGGAVYRVVWAGMVITGIGWGLIETVINPLTTTLYPEEKTARLNTLHAWWPGGIIVGGLLGLLLGQFDMSWQGKMYVTLIPAALFGILCLSTKFPPTERIQSGLPASVMFQELKRPMVLVWFGSMFLTAASELAPGQWVDMALTRTVGMQGIWLLIYVGGLMFVMRHFAGPLAHRLSPVGLLWCSCLLASAGLVALSLANSPVTGLLAATLWGTGVCYMWPTMLAAASERFPRGGSLLMGLMGTAGTLSSYFVLPILGQIFDAKKIEFAGGEAQFNALTGAAREQVLGAASQISFRYVAALPLVLLLVFGAIWQYERMRGGLKPRRLTVTNPAAAGD